MQWETPKLIVLSAMGDSEGKAEQNLVEMAGYAAPS